MYSSVQCKLCNPAIDAGLQWMNNYKTLPPPFTFCALQLTVTKLKPLLHACFLQQYDLLHPSDSSYKTKPSFTILAFYIPCS